MESPNQELVLHSVWRPDWPMAQPWHSHIQMMPAAGRSKSPDGGMWDLEVWKGGSVDDKFANPNLVCCILRAVSQ